MKLHRFKSWIIEFIKWVLVSKPAILFVLMLLAAVLLGFYTWSSETSIRVSGYALQLAGMILAIDGLLQIRIHFDQKPLFYQLKEWWRGFPKWRKPGDMTATCSLGSVTASSHLTAAWAADEPEKPVEERINAIVKNLDQLLQAQVSHAGWIKDLKKSHAEQKEEAEKQNLALQAKLRDEMKEAHTRDLHYSFVGLLWLTIGITFSTLPSEICQILNYLRLVIF